MQITKFFILIVLIFTTSFAMSQEIETRESHETSNIDKNLVVTKVEFDGLKKTKESYIQPKYQKYIGKRIEEIDTHKLETELQTEGLFDKIEISFFQSLKEDNVMEENLTMKIKVTEKITFIPLPFAMYSSSGFMAGLMVMDTNAFGVKDMFMVGGFYSSESLTGMATFASPPKDDGTPGFSTFLSASKNEPEISNINNDTLTTYQNNGFLIAASVTEKFKKNNALKLQLRFTLVNSDSDKRNASSINSVKIGNAELSYAYSTSDWNGYFLSSNEFSALFSVSKYFGLNNNSNLSSWIQNYESKVSFQKPFFTNKLRICGHFGGEVLASASGKSAHISEYKDRGSVNVTILPGNFKTNKILGGAIGFETALKKFNFGLLALYGNYELVWADDFSFESSPFSLKNMDFCHGPNGGLRLYLSKIAFPALAFGLSYNIPKSYSQFSMALGISM